MIIDSGANEAPPAIISIFLGRAAGPTSSDQIKSRRLSRRSKQKGNDDRSGSIFSRRCRSHAGDRNRTSPFAFTGNRFEFRAVGSNQTIAFPLVVMNCIVAESLDYIATQIEAVMGGDTSKLHEAVQKSLQAIAVEHSAIIFGGNGYSQEWHEEAAKRGLPNLRNTVEALPALIEPENIALFGKYGILSEREVISRYDIYLERYCMDINTEAMLALEIAKTKILPSALSYQMQLAALALSLKSLNKEPNTGLLDQVIEQTALLETGIHTLEHALAHESDGDTLAHAKHFRDEVIPAMLAVRGAADALEGMVSDELWPLPTYQEMLFIK